MPIFLSVRLSRLSRAAGRQWTEGRLQIDAAMSKISSSYATAVSDSVCVYTVIHNYGNPYEKWNIFVARPHLWLQLGTVKPEIMLCETVLNLSTLNTLTYLRTY